MCCFGRVEILILDFSASFLRYKFGGMRPAMASTPCHVRESRHTNDVRVFSTLPNCTRIINKRELSSNFIIR